MRWHRLPQLRKFNTWNSISVRTNAIEDPRLSLQAPSPCPRNLHSVNVNANANANVMTMTETVVTVVTEDMVNVNGVRMGPMTMA